MKSGDRARGGEEGCGVEGEKGYAGRGAARAAGLQGAGGESHLVFWGLLSSSLWAIHTGDFVLVFIRVIHQGMPPSP